MGVGQVKRRRSSNGISQLVILDGGHKMSDVLFSVELRKGIKGMFGRQPSYYVLVQNYRGRSSDLETFATRKEAMAELKKRRASRDGK